MAGDIKSKYGASNTTITIALVSLADNGKVSSSEIDNSSDLFWDALVQIKVKTGVSGINANGTIPVYAMGSVDGGTTYPDSANVDTRLIGIMNANASAATFQSNPMSVAAAFNGVLPQKWKIVVENQTSSIFDTTSGNHAAFYQGIFSQYT
jgi:hypothetical protein